jgi:hypothetical protein
VGCGLKTWFANSLDRRRLARDDERHVISRKALRRGAGRWSTGSFT